MPPLYTLMIDASRGKVHAARTGRREDKRRLHISTIPKISLTSHQAAVILTIIEASNPTAATPDEAGAQRL
ncbi:hypothetical protein [Azospirillum sp. Marseille-Q6669]